MHRDNAKRGLDSDKERKDILSEARRDVIGMRKVR